MQTLSFTHWGIARITGACQLIPSTGRGIGLAFGGIETGRHKEKPLVVLGQKETSQKKKSTYLFITSLISPLTLTSCHYLSGKSK